MSTEMTSRERVLSALKGDSVDRIPVISSVSLANSECMKLTKCFYPNVCLNASRIAALAETSYTELKFDSIMPYFGTLNEAGSLGCDIIWGNGEHPSIFFKSVLRDPDDFQPPRNYLDAKPLKAIITAISMLKSKHGGNAALIGKIIGPLSIIFYLYGIQNTLNCLILTPEKIINLLKETEKLCASFALAQIEAGVDIMTISEDAAGFFISRECYKKTVMDIERNLMLQIQKYVPVIFHLSGKITDRVDLFRDTGFDALSFDSRNNLNKLKADSGNMKLVGGVNIPMVLLNGKPEDVTADVYNALAHGVDIISPEGAVHPRITSKNLITISEAVRKYEKIHSYR